VFLPELTAPAELPPEMLAFKAQQFRWTKGGAQTALKILPKVFLSKAPLKVKIESFFHLTSFTVHIYMMALVLLLFPALYLQTVPMEQGTVWRGVFDISVFALATFSAGVFYMASQVELFGDWRTVLKYMPMLMGLGIGMCVSNTKAILEALFGHQSEFVRTPKYGQARQAAGGGSDGPKKKSRGCWLPYVEFAFGVYMSVCAVASVINFRAAMSTPFLLIFAFGFFYVSLLSFQARRIDASEPEAAAAPARTDS
jgi:hypothetical protein